jgi:hypothetical protein
MRQPVIPCISIRGGGRPSSTTPAPWTSPTKLCRRPKTTSAAHFHTQRQLCFQPAAVAACTTRSWRSVTGACRKGRAARRGPRTTPVAKTASPLPVGVALAALLRKPRRVLPSLSAVQDPVRATSLAGPAWGVVPARPWCPDGPLRGRRHPLAAAAVLPATRRKVVGDPVGAPVPWLLREPIGLVLVATSVQPCCLRPLQSAVTELTLGE